MIPEPSIRTHNEADILRHRARRSHPLARQERALARRVQSRAGRPSGRAGWIE
jgi:hypothetical protein